MSGARPPWRKLLYLPQQYPDNYTDTSFLSQLKRNTTVAKYSYVTLVDHFSLVAMHISGLVIVQLVFTHIYMGTLDAIVPAVVCSGISAACYTLLSLHGATGMTLRPFIVIMIVLLILSPVLRSLTQSTSLDLIWALSLILCVANTITHDYDMHAPAAGQKRQYRPILSTNVALLNAIVLASRLRTTSQVFCFVLFAVELGILLPWFDVSARRKGMVRVHRLTLGAVVMSATYFVGVFNSLVLVVWILCICGISLGLPAYYLFLQRYKNELQGPWDMAKPVINDR